MAKNQSTAPGRVVPSAEVLVTGRMEVRRRLFARRPQGTGDWLFICMEGGVATFGHAGGRFVARERDCVLIRPGVPHDYGLLEARGYWKNTWVHFLPRPECLAWMRWPEFAQGMMSVHLDGRRERQVAAALKAMAEAAHAPGRRHTDLAVNALERVLLLCDSMNPRHGEAHPDSRVARAIELLCEDVSRTLSLEELARRCGLSRSRLARLFRIQVGTSPLAFLEAQRLQRAREALAHTSLPLAEIADKTGFSSPFYLSVRFKKAFGASPRDYRRDARR